MLDLIASTHESAVRINLIYVNSVLYEVFPMSFLMEQAGGQAFTGKQRVLTW